MRSQRHSLGVVVKQVNEAVGPRGVNMEEEGQVNHHSQGEQQSLHRQARPDEHDHSQHGQQAAVQVVLDVWRKRYVGKKMLLWQVRCDVQSLHRSAQHSRIKNKALSGLQTTLLKVEKMFLFYKWRKNEVKYCSVEKNWSTNSWSTAEKALKLIFSILLKATGNAAFVWEYSNSSLKLTNCTLLFFYSMLCFASCVLSVWKKRNILLQVLY